MLFMSYHTVLKLHSVSGPTAIDRPLRSKSYMFVGRFLFG